MMRVHANFQINYVIVVDMDVMDWDDAGEIDALGALFQVLAYSCATNGLGPVITSHKERDADRARCDVMSLQVWRIALGEPVAGTSHARTGCTCMGYTETPTPSGRIT